MKTVRAVNELSLVDGREDLPEMLARPPALFDWCSSLWDSDDVVRHQCILPPRHAGGCVCACGEQR